MAEAGKGTAKLSLHVLKIKFFLQVAVIVKGLSLFHALLYVEYIQYRYSVWPEQRLSLKVTMLLLSQTKKAEIVKVVVVNSVMWAEGVQKG